MSTGDIARLAQNTIDEGDGGGDSFHSFHSSIGLCSIVVGIGSIMVGIVVLLGVEFVVATFEVGVVFLK